MLTTTLRVVAPPDLIKVTSFSVACGRMWGEMGSPRVLGRLGIVASTMRLSLAVRTFRPQGHSDL
jgi:hypothetical protein